MISPLWVGSAVESWPDRSEASSEPVSLTALERFFEGEGWVGLAISWDISKGERTELAGEWRRPFVGGTSGAEGAGRSSSSLCDSSSLGSFSGARSRKTERGRGRVRGLAGGALVAGASFA